MRYQIFFAILIYTCELNASASFSYSSSVVVCARRCGGYRIVAVPCRAPASPFFFASLGGSAVFLFGLTRAPAAQPRALFGGHLGGALIGIACYQLLGDSLWVYVVAQVLVLWYMLITKTVHPPAGANPIIMIYGHSSLSALWQPVLVGVLSLAVVAVIWSRLYPGLSHYPVAWLDRSPPSLFWGGWNE
jgi:CBS-domain-containing membrane protein